MSYGNYPDLNNVKKILVIKMRHHGDVLLTSPVFSNLKKHLPDAEIDAFIYLDTLPMLEGHPAISSYLTYDRSWKKLSFFSKLKKEWKLLLHIRKKKYDLVINLTEGDRGAIAALFSRSPIRVGFDPGKKGFLGKKKSYTHIVKNCSTPRHAVERQLDSLRKIGIFPAIDDRALTFELPEKVEEDILDLLKKHTIQKGEYILFHPVSRWRFKCPPMSLIKETIQDLLKEEKKVILTGGPSKEECAMIEEIVSSLPSEGVLNLSGKTTLKELGVLIKFSRMVVCVDSVPLHLASALKIPVVVLFGPSSELNWGPWQHPDSIVLRKDLPCRPCGLDGCGGSKRSDCLYTFSKQELLHAVHKLYQSQKITVFGAMDPHLILSH